MALTIGSLIVDPPVVLAPMAGITNAAFRTLCREQGAGLYVSEMVSARALVERNPRTRSMVSFGPDETPRSVQLYGVDPATIGEAVRILVGEYGVKHVDLNFGCPVAKVTRSGGGAALPLHRFLLARIVAAAVDAAGADRVPVTVKFRIGIDDAHRVHVQTGRVAESEGAAALALHSRTAEQGYSGKADWTAIAELKEHITTIPVLGNGDVWHAEDALALMAATGCDGVVVGRGCLGRPWLFRDLAYAFAGRAGQTPPKLAAVMATMRRHAELLAERLGEDSGVRSFRKHVSWYLLGYPVGRAARQRLPLVGTLAELDARLGELDPGATLPGGRAPAPRGNTSGPRRVALPPRWLERLDDPSPPAGAELVLSGG